MDDAAEPPVELSHRLRVDTTTAATVSRALLVHLHRTGPALRWYVLPLALLLLCLVDPARSALFVAMALLILAMTLWSAYRGLWRGAVEFYPPGAEVATGFGADAMVLSGPGLVSPARSLRGEPRLVPYDEVVEVVATRRVVLLRLGEGEPFHVFPRRLFPDPDLERLRHRAGGGRRAAP